MKEALARVVVANALKRYINNPDAWGNSDIKENILNPIIEDVTQTYMKRLENTDYNSSVGYSTDGYSATADTSSLFAAYIPLLYHYRKPRTVSQNDKTDWNSEGTT